MINLMALNHCGTMCISSSWATASTM